MLILLNDCVQLLPPSRALSFLTWRGQLTSLSSCSKIRTMRKEEGSWRHKSGREHEMNERGLMQSGRGEGNSGRREGLVEEKNGEVCTSKALAALESSIFLTLQRVRVRITVALLSSVLESRLPRLFDDCMPCISFSLLASSFWPEIPTKSVFIGDVQWKLSEDVSASPEQWPGEVVGLVIQCVYMGSKNRAARQQGSKLIATALGVQTFMLAMPVTSRETSCVGCAQETKITLLLGVTSKHGPPALFESVCKLFNPGDWLLCGEAISLSPICIS